VREGGRCQLGAYVIVVKGGAACGRARLDAVDEKEMMQPLNNMPVNLDITKLC
jgi:hypothetical protein